MSLIHEVRYGPLLEELKVWLDQRNYSVRFLLSDTTIRDTALKHIGGPKALGMEETHCMYVSPGENRKNLATTQRIWEWLSAAKADRKGLLLNLGGGVICDLGGFAAATYKRGLDFIHIPTTLLAMADAALGGKNGIDLDSEKNLVGLFRSPKSVFIDWECLKTLPEPHIRNGMAEILKHGLIADEAYFNHADTALGVLNQASHPKTDPGWKELIQGSVQIKMNVVNLDPYEQIGIRKKLNFGHTVGHALESLFLSYPAEDCSHGQAVTTGMLCEAYISTRKKLLAPDALDRIVSVLAALFPPLVWPASDDDRLIEFIRNDKKNEHGTIRLTLLKEIGKAVTDVSGTEQEIKDALTWYRKQ